MFWLLDKVSQPFRGSRNAGLGTAFADVPGPRTGVWRTHTPSVVRLDDGSYRMYFTESGPGLHWTQSRGRILSAVSADGAVWSPEPRVRLGPHDGGAEMQVTSPELVPAISADGVLGHRLYFEAIPGKMATDGRGNTLGEAQGSTTIHSAFSTDHGLSFEVEPGVRFGQPDQTIVNYGSARCVYLPDGRCRLYLYRRTSYKTTIHYSKFLFC